MALLCRVCFLVVALVGTFLLGGCKSPPSIFSAPGYYSLTGILGVLDTSLWTVQEDLADGVLKVDGKTVNYPQLHAHVPHVGFFDGQTKNRRLVSFSISVRGKRLGIPRRHWADLFNLSFEGRKTWYCYFGSVGEYDVIQIFGGSGERTYTVYFVSKNGRYLGRRLARIMDRPEDDFSMSPEEL